MSSGQLTPPPPKEPEVDVRALTKEWTGKLGQRRLRELKQLCLDAVKLSQHLEADGSFNSEAFEQFNDKVAEAELSVQERHVVMYYMNLGATRTLEKYAELREVLEKEWADQVDLEAEDEQEEQPTQQPEKEQQG